MFRSQRLNNPFLVVLLTLVSGCFSATGPVRATWEYVELTKDKNGHVQEIGSKHVLRSGGDESYPLKGSTLDVVTVTSAKAKFRLTSSDSPEKKEADLQPGDSQDLWLESFGVRLRLEKIGPIP